MNLKEVPAPCGAKRTQRKLHPPPHYREFNYVKLPEIIAAIFNLTEKGKYGFHVAYEPALIETIIEAAELPMTGESYAEVKSQLFTTSMLTALKGIGVEVTRSKGDYLTVWGPGVKK